MSESCDSGPVGLPSGCPAIRRVMMPRDTNALGTIFGGVILSEIDLAAAVEAQKHWAHRVVTVAMDGIEFHQPVHVGDLVSFFTTTDRLGRSSIRVKVDVWAQRRFGSRDHLQVTVAYVTMVAVDEVIDVHARASQRHEFCDAVGQVAELTRLVALAEHLRVSAAYALCQARTGGTDAAAGRSGDPAGGDEPGSVPTVWSCVHNDQRAGGDPRL